MGGFSDNMLSLSVGMGNVPYNCFPSLLPPPPTGLGDRAWATSSEATIYPETGVGLQGASGQP